MTASASEICEAFDDIRHILGIGEAGSRLSVVAEVKRLKAADDEAKSLIDSLRAQIELADPPSIAGAVQDVRDFHEAITAAEPKVGIPECTGTAGLVRRVLRHRLLREEWIEYQDANLASDRVEVLDALVDIVYIAIGTALIQFGGDRFARAWDAVHSSNMAKRWDDGTFHVREDGKVLKPPGWVGPDILGIVEGPAQDDVRRLREERGSR